MREREHLEDEASAVERLVGRGLDDQAGKGSPLSERARQSQRSVETYLKGGGVPRWMERLGEIDAGVALQQRRLERAHRALRRECGRDVAVFAERWIAAAHAWPFGELNELIEQHNEWYPVERQLPLDPRTGEYVRVAGRSYRRAPLDAAWVLERFPVN